MAPSAALAAGRDQAFVALSGMRPDAVLELKPVLQNGAELVWEWRSRDHLIQDFDETKANYGDVGAHPERIDFNGDHCREAPLTSAKKKRCADIERRMRATGQAGGGDDPDATPVGDAVPARGPGRDSDWLHVNGLHWLESHDLIVLSVRHVDEIWVIDHSTTTAEARGSTGERLKRGGDLLARYGNPKMHGGGTAAALRVAPTLHRLVVVVDRAGAAASVRVAGSRRKHSSVQRTSRSTIRAWPIVSRRPSPGEARITVKKRRAPDA